jgi:hypothetical protein
MVATKGGGPALAPPRSLLQITARLAAQSESHNGKTLTASLAKIAC